MSWQCSYCETVNQDAVPVCTVCERLAPVVESYLSLETIHSATDYNEKLEEVHRFEAEGDFDNMLASSLEAIALYKDNSLAVKKAETSIKLRYEAIVSKELVAIIDKSIKKSNFEAASGALAIWNKLGFNKAEISEYKEKVLANKKRQQTISEAISSATNKLFEDKVEEALSEIEQAMTSFPDDKRLVDFRDGLELLITQQKQKAKENLIKRQFPKPRRQSTEMIETHGQREHEGIISLGEPCKYPKVKRKK